MKTSAGEIVSKECKTCGEIKDLSEFNRQKGGVGGKRSRCRKCTNEYLKEDRKKNPLKYNSKHRIEYRKKYFETYYAENSTTIKNRSRVFYYSHRNDKDFIKKRADNKKRWARENPEMITLQNHRRMARKRNLPNDFTESDMQETLKKFEGKCALTGEECDIHWDHVIPLSTGHGGTVSWNMLPIKSSLNVSKGDRHIIEWFEDNKNVYNLSETRLRESFEYLANLKGVSVESYIKYIDWCFENKKEGIYE